MDNGLHMGNIEAGDLEENEVVGRATDDFRIETGKETELFHLLDEALDVGISVLDENLNYIYVNRSAAKTLQIKEGEFKVGNSKICCFGYGCNSRKTRGIVVCF